MRDSRVLGDLTHDEKTRLWGSSANGGQRDAIKSAAAHCGRGSPRNFVTLLYLWIQENRMVERTIRRLREQCARRRRFESRQQAIGDSTQFFNGRRPHEALGVKTTEEA